MQHISSILSAWVTTTPYDQIAECLLHISMQLQAMPKAKRYQEVIAMCKDDAVHITDLAWAANELWEHGGDEDRELVKVIITEILPLTILNLASQIDRQCIDRRDGGVPYDTAVLMARMELNEVVSKGVETWRKSVFCPEKIKLLESLTNYREGRTLPSLIRDARPLMMRTIKAERTIVALAQEITKQ